MNESNAIAEYAPEKRRKLWFIGSGVLLLAVLVLGWFWGRPAYRRHKETQAVVRAKAFLEQRHYPNASVSARQALVLNPKNLEACRVMATLAELARSPALLDWLKRIAEIDPTPENKLRLASVALRYQPAPYSASAQILDQLANQSSNLTAFHLVAAELALKLNAPADAERHFSLAAQLEPTNQLYQLNLAVLRLHHTNDSVATAARATLLGLSTQTNLGPVALRWLVGDALARKANTEALDRSRQLIAQPRATLEDQLQHLEVLRRVDATELTASLGRLQHQYATNAAAIYVLAGWMSANQLGPDAIAWLRGLPGDLRSQTPVQLALTESLAAQSDWPAVEELIRAQDWKEMEFLRFAYRSRAVEKTGGGMGVEGHWRTAVRETGDRVGALMILLDRAGPWGRNRAREDLLWRVAERYPAEKWAFHELDRIYIATGNTAGLNRLYSALLVSNPTNVVLKNNLAATSLLLRVKLTEAHQLAQDVYRHDPADPILASTYAFSLHQQGQTREALAAIEKLRAEQLGQYPVALYYGVLLWKAGRTNEAAPYLSTAKKSKLLLPEERALLDSSR